MNMITTVQLEHVRNGHYYTVTIPFGTPYSDAIEILKLFIDQLNMMEANERATLQKQEEEKQSMQKQIADAAQKKTEQDPTTPTA